MSPVGGFDWADATGAFEKVAEELEEVRQQLEALRPVDADGHPGPGAGAEGGMVSEFWDARYAGDDYHFGTEPAAFVARWVVLSRRARDRRSTGPPAAKSAAPRRRVFSPAQPHPQKRLTPRRGVRFHAGA